MAALANAVRSRHDAPTADKSPNAKETSSSSSRASGWEWVSSIDQMPLWGNVASDQAVQAALRDARATKQFPANFLKPKNRWSGE